MKQQSSEIKNAIDQADLMIIGGNSFMEISENEFLHGVSSYSATLATLKFVTHHCIVLSSLVY